MNLKPLALALLCVVLAREETVCPHRGAGATKKVSLEDVRRAREEVKEKLRLAWTGAGRLSAESPFDCGLPACGRRSTRIVATAVPRELVGKTVAFAAAERLPKADFRVATSARKIGDLQADALADRQLTGRLGVRCVPTLVRMRSEVDLELVEGD